jgi:hypothetical protein
MFFMEVSIPLTGSRKLAVVIDLLLIGFDQGQLAARQ